MDTLDFVTHKFTNTVAEVIREYTATKYSDLNTFETLINEAYRTGVASSEQWNSVCWPGEKEVLDWMETQGESCTYRRKDGTLDITKGEGGYKISKVGMGKSTYSSSKAVIGKAVDAGISLKDKDGNFKGKTLLEKETRETVKSRNAGAGDDSVETTPKSEFDKAVIVIETLAKIYGKLNDSEQIAVAQILSDKGIV